MTHPILSRERTKYTLYGALFGLAFPAFSILFLTVVSENVWTLFGIICSAPLFLGIFARFAGVRQDSINEINRGLEREVEARTAAIRTMLDVSGQGFLTFGADFKVHAEYSRECEAIFGRSIGGELIHELLFENERAREDFVQGFSLYFAGTTNPEVLFELLETSTLIDGKTIRIEYRAIDEKRAMCTLTDISEEIALQEKLAAEDSRRNLLYRVVVHKKYFGSFVREANELAEYMDLLVRVKAAEGQLNELKRKVHTFKGNASFFAFNNTRQFAEDLEYYIADRLTLGEGIDLSGHAIAFKRVYYNELKNVSDTLGHEWIQESDAITVPADHYIRIERYVEKRYAEDGKLVSTLKHFRKTPLKNMFTRFPDIAERLAEKLGKRIAPIEIRGGNERILSDRYHSAVRSFDHIVRNMIDHGIESPGERELKGKDPEGKVTIDLKAYDDRISIIFSDDGAGISLLAIEEKARELGIIKDGIEPTREFLLTLLFRADFTTSSAVTATSGRGIGLSAVKTEVDRLGGKILVSSKPNQGTVFKIELPKK